MPRSGLANTRTKPRVTVLRGFDPNAPMTLTQSLPVKSGQTILSGQLVSSSWDSSVNQHAWSLGPGSNATPYIALQDGADQDVSEAGKLTGLSCAGQFEIQTAYYTGGATAAVGALVVPSSTTGSVAPTSATGQLILGMITRAPSGEGMTPSTLGYGVGAQYAPVTISPSYTGGSGSATGPGAIFYPGIDSSSTPPALVITFATAYNGTKTVA
jgi:hypothetical protein